MAFEILDFIREEFKGIKLGVLDDDNKIQELSHTISTHHGLPNDPLAQLCYKRKLTLKSDRIMIDNSPKNIELLKKLDKSMQGEIETHHRTFGKEDILTIFEEYHNIIDGGLTANRINGLENRVISARKDTEHLNKEIQTSEQVSVALSTNLNELSKNNVVFAKTVTEQMTHVGHLITGNVTMQQNINNLMSTMQTQLSQMQVQLNSLSQKENIFIRIIKLIKGGRQ